MAVLPSAESATLWPKWAAPTEFDAVSFGPCWIQSAGGAALVRAKIQIAPTLLLSASPPMMAVLPSAESATAPPCIGRPGCAGANDLCARL